MDLKSWWSKVRGKGAIDRTHFEASGLDTGLGPRSMQETFPKQPGEIQPEIAARIYANSPFVNAAVRILADQLSSVPLRVYVQERTGSKRKEKTIGQPFAMLDWVNPHMTKSQLIVNTVSWLKLAGNAFWAIEPTPDEYRNIAPSEWSIYPMNPQFVKIMPDPETGINYYRYEVNGKKVDFDESRVIHFKNFSPYDHWWGHSDLNSLSFDMQVERYAKKQISTYYANAAVINGVVMIPEAVHEDEVRKIKKELFYQHQGSRNAHRVLVLTEGIKYEPFKTDQKDVGSVPVLENSAQAHAMVLGVPLPLLTGSTGSGQSKDLLQYESLMWKQTLIPLAKLISETLTKRLAVPFGMKIQQRVAIEFDFTKIAALRKEQLDWTRADVADVMSGIKSLNEVREERGNLEPYGEDVVEDFLNGPLSVALAKFQASTSLSLPGSEGSPRDQSSNGETQHVDTSGKKDILDSMTDTKMMSDPERLLQALRDFSDARDNSVQ